MKLNQTFRCCSGHSKKANQRAYPGSGVVLDIVALFLTLKISGSLMKVESIAECSP